MELLQSFDFTRPSRSRYAPAVKALMEDRVFAVLLKRGEDFPADITMASVQGGIRDKIAKAGGRARIFPTEEGNLVVSLWPEGEGPKRPTRRARRTPVAA
jgi:hypothetical protein